MTVHEALSVFRVTGSDVRSAQYIVRRSLNTYCIVDRNVHVLTVKTESTPFLLCMLWTKGIILILQGQYQYEVNNLNTND